MSKKFKRVAMSWKSASASDSQIGQLMYYLMGAQMRCVQVHPSSPPPLLGFFMEEGMVQNMYAVV